MITPDDLLDFDHRALTMDDATAVRVMVNASEAAVDGEAMTTVGEIEAVWSRKSFDLETMSIGVEDRGRLVAVAEVFDERADVTVHPDFAGRGIGTSLARWTWEVARAHGQIQVGQTVSDANVAARDLFVGLGYAPRWTSWVLQMGLKGLDAEPALPDRASLRPMRSDDFPRIYRLVEDAFNEWPDRNPSKFEDWRALTVDHISVRLDLSVVACWDEQPVGVGIAFDYEDGEAWVEQLAVSADHRGRGLARAILARMFNQFADAGYQLAGLSTDSRTGALGLYERVGMTVRRSYTRWNLRL